LEMKPEKVHSERALAERPVSTLFEPEVVRR